MFLFEEALCKICEKCPMNGTDRTYGLSVKKQRGSYICVDSVEPSVVIVFRDPKIKKDRYVPYVLDIKYVKEERASSRLFDTYDKHLLRHFPEGESVYLDNFIRCRISIKSDEIRSNYLSLLDGPPTYCMEILKSLLRIRQHVKCLVFADITPLVWLAFEGSLVIGESKVGSFLKGIGGNSTILLGKSFEVRDWNFPVFFFPHPNTLLQQNRRYCYQDSRYYKEFIDGREAILRVLR